MESLANNTPQDSIFNYIFEPITPPYSQSTEKPAEENNFESWWPEETL